VLGPEDVETRPLQLRRALVRGPDPEAAAALAFRILRPADCSIVPAAAAASRPELQGRSVLILRAPEDSFELTSRLQAAGAEARCEPPIELHSLVSSQDLRAAVEALPEGRTWVPVASRGAARLLAAGLRDAGLAPELAFRHRRVAAVGPGTAEELAREGIPADFLAEESTGGGLARELLAMEPPRDTVVFLPAARDGRPELREALQEAGYDVRHLALYETRPRPVPALSARPWDVVVLASPSGVAALPETGVTARLVALGPTTAAAVAQRGLPLGAVAAQPTPEGLFEAVAAALRAEPRNEPPTSG
jgi:uroporphyrinogen-III synthase